MHFRILLGGHYHLVCLKLHGVAVRVLLGVVHVLDKAAFHGALAITVKDVPDQVGKALVVAFTGTFNALLLVYRVIFRLGVVGTIAAGKALAASDFCARNGDSFRYEFGGVIQLLIEPLLQLPALKGCGEGNRVLAHGYHVLLVGLGQVSKGQIVTANVIALSVRIEKCIAAGVVVIGHIAVGRQIRLVQVDLVVAMTTALGLICVDLNDLCIFQVQPRIIFLIFRQGILCALFSGRIILFGVRRSKPTGRRCLIFSAQFAVSHLALDLVENALCGGVVVYPLVIPAGTGILVVASVVLVVALVVVGDAIHQLRLRALSGHKLVSVLAPFQRGVQQNAVVDLRLSVFLLLRQSQLGIRCQIKVVDVVVAIENLSLFIVDLYIVVFVGNAEPICFPPCLDINTLRNTLHLTSGIPVVRRCSFPRCGAIVEFAVLLGGGFQRIQVLDQLSIGHGIVVDHVPHQTGNLFPCRCFGNGQVLDLAVLLVLNDKGLTGILSFLTGFFQILEECILGFFLGAAGGCNLVRLLDFHSQFFFLSNVACRVGLAIFSLVGNGLIFKVQSDKVASKFCIKLSPDLFLGQLLGGNGDDGHSVIGIGLFVGSGSIFSCAFQRHPGIGRAAVCKVNRSIVAVLAAPCFLRQVNRRTILNGSGLGFRGLRGHDCPAHPGQGCVQDFRIPVTPLCGIVQRRFFGIVQVVQLNIFIRKAIGLAIFILIAGDPASIGIRFNLSCALRFRIEILTNTQCAHAGSFIFSTIEIGDLGACHIRRAFNGVVHHIGDVLGLLAGNILIFSFRSYNRYLGTGVGQGVGLAANCFFKGAAVRVKSFVGNGTRQLCLDRVLNAQLTHCVVQGIPDGVHLSLALFFGPRALVFYAPLLRGRQGHGISEAPAEKLVLCYVQLNFLLVRGGVVDGLAVLAQFVVLVAIFFQSVNDLCVAQLRFSGLGSLLNNVLLAVLGEMNSVIHHCTMIEHLFQILGLNGLNHFVAILDLDTGVCHLVSERFTAILHLLFPGDGQLGGGPGGDLVVLNGDVGGAGLGVALCVQNGLGPGEGIGAVGVHRGLFGIHQLGDVFGGHLGGGLFLFPQLEGLLVAVLRVGHFLYLVAVDRVSALLNIPADVRVLAQLLRQVDVLLLDLFLFLVQIALGLAGAGGGGGLRAGGHGGLGDGGGAVRVLLHGGRGGGVHNGLCAGVGLRLHVGLGLLGLFSGADLLGLFLLGFFFLGLFLFELFLFGVSLAAVGVGVGVGVSLAAVGVRIGVGVGLAAVGVGIGIGVGFAAAGVGVGLAAGLAAGFARASFAGASLAGAGAGVGFSAALGVGHDHAIQLLGAVRVGRGMFFIIFDFRILQGLLSIFSLLVVLRFCGVFLFLGFLRHRLLFLRSCFRSICVCCQRACGHTSGQGHGHCRHLQFFVRHGSCSFPESCCLFQGVHRASIIAER